MGVRRPWNMVNVPVYSLATYDEDAGNMNICTYVSAVSMKPKLFMVAVDYSTKTYENLQNGSKGILQVLHKDHLNLVNLLGKKSGKQINKEARLASKELLTIWNGHQVIDNACAYMNLELRGTQNIGGDHALFWFEVVKSKTISEDNILMFQDLVNEGLIL